MNLIEQLGGYEKAKELRRYLFCYVDGEHYLDVDAAILKYRRQHNIFEVGDICKLKIKHDFGLYKFRRIDGDRIYLEDQLGFAEFGINRGVVEHATDEEIAAGRRL